MSTQYSVAGGTNGTTGIIAYSTNNGVNWTSSDASNIFTTGYVSGIAYSNSIFVAVGTNGKIAYSYSPNSWTVVSVVSEPSGFIGVAYGNGHFIAVVNAASKPLYYSSNGTSWSTTQYNISQQPSSITYISLSNRWVITLATVIGANGVFRDVDAGTNNPFLTSATDTISGMGWGFWGGQPGSTNGIDYIGGATPRYVLVGYSTATPSGLVGYNGSTLPNASYSFAISSGGWGKFTGVKCNGTRFVVVGTGGLANTYSTHHSSNGSTWTQTTASILKNVDNYCVNYGNSKWFIGGKLTSSNCIYTAVDGSNDWVAAISHPFGTGTNASAGVYSITAVTITPVLGSTPTLTVSPVLNTANVVKLTYTQTTPGTTPVTYYYTTINNANTTSRTQFTTNPFDVSNISNPTTFYVVASNTAGNVISLGVSGAPYVVPSSPNSVSANFSNSNISVTVTDTNNRTNNDITYLYYAYKSTDISNNSGNIGSYTSGTAFTSSPTTINISTSTYVAGTYTIYVVAKNTVGNSSPVASSTVNVLTVPLAPIIDTGNTKSTSSGTIRVSLTDASNSLNNGVGYYYSTGTGVQVQATNADISFISQTSQKNGNNSNLGFAISQQGTTRVAIFCGGVVGDQKVIKFSKITNGTWTDPSLISTSFDIAPSTSNPDYLGCSMTADATRLIVPVGTFTASSELYWANATGLLGTSTSLSFKRITSATRNYTMTSVTADGSRLLVSVYNATSGQIYYSDWNGTNNYGTLVPILDTTPRIYFGVYISSDKQKILYAADSTVYWSVWNGTNYPVGTSIQLNSTARSVAIFGYGTQSELLISTPYGNAGAQYATWNGTGYNALSQVSTSVIPNIVNGWGLTVDSSSIYLALYDNNNVYIANIYSSSGFIYNYTNSNVLFDGRVGSYQFDVSGLTTQSTPYTIGVRAQNIVGNSTVVSTSPLPVFGNLPVISSVLPILGQANSLKVTYSQAFKGTDPVTYYYSLNADGSNRVAATDVSFVIPDASQATIIYVIADNSAGNVISLGVSGTPYLLGSPPSINSIVPSVGNTVTVNFTQTTLGSGTTIYYYGFDGSGVRTDASASTSPLIITGLNNTTPYSIYLVARNEAGDISSNAYPNVNVLGTKPVITGITKNVGNSVTVAFSQSQKGTSTVVYYYSLDGSNVRLDASSSGTSLTIPNLTEYTAYNISIVARNPAGDVFSDASSGITVLGTTPTISNITSNIGNSVTVSFSQSQKGTDTTIYYGSLDGSNIIQDASSSETSLTIRNLRNTAAYTIYVIARNPAGDVSSIATSGVNILGEKPVITGITKNVGNSVTVAFTQSQKGTSPVVYYYSLDGSNVRLDASASSSPITISGLTNDTSYNISIVARNPAGDVFSDASSGITILGTTPTLTASPILYANRNVRLSYGQTSKGTLPVTYYYTTDNSANTVNRIEFPIDSSTVDVSGVTGATTYYAIASNSAGNLISTGAPVTPYLLGSAPVIGTITPGVYQLTVNFSQSPAGTLPTRYYYSIDGTTKLGPGTTASPLVITGVSGPTTFYLIADNSAGNVVSTSTATATPYYIGNNPIISSIVPNTSVANSVIVNFTQSQVGNSAPVYYYGFDGSGVRTDASATTSPLVITGLNNTTQYSIYLVARNEAGDISSNAYPNVSVLGTKPVITGITKNVGNSVTVAFSQTQTGTSPVVYYYSLDGSNVRLDASSTETSITIPNLTEYTAYNISIVARNPAGDVFSDPSNGITVLGTTPTISNITSNIGNSVTVSFSQSQNGTGTTTYYGSLDGSNIIQDASSSGTSLTISNLTDASAYTIYVIARNSAGDVPSIATTGVNILGTKPVITGITKNVGNSITVAFSQSQKGTDTTTYYGSLDGSNIIQDASSSGTSLTISNLTDASAYNIYIIARNPAGDIVSDASSGIHIFGTKPTISNITRNIGNSVTVAFSHSQKGTGTTTYYGSTNGSTVLLDASSSGDSLIISNLTDASAYTIYVIARNPAGDVPSDPSLNVSILGTQPSFTLVPQTNNLRGTITHANKGTLPVNYYYSSDGINKDFEVSFPTFDISGTSTRTFYIIAENSAGMNPSSPVSGTPYVFGDAPVISSIVPGSQVLTVNFSQQQTGTTPVKYYYSYDPSGTVRIGQVNPPSFDIVGTDPRTVYIVVDNSAGTLVSAGVSGTPYVFGSLPRITLIQRGSEKITVTYTQTDKGTLPVRYYYSFDRVNRIAEVTTTATFDISTVETRTVSIIADNSAGTLVSDDVSGTPYTFGSVPQIQSVTPGPNRLTVLFSQANVGNTPSSYSYSFDPSGTNPTAFDSSSTFIVNGSQPRTIYVIATNLAGSLISMGVSGTPFVVGDTPSIDDVVPGPYSLTVKFSQPNQGNTPVTYYYSYSVDGSNPQGPVYLPEFTVTASTTTTIYVVADSSSGYIVSAGFTKTPYVLGSNPEIVSIKPGTEILDVSFSQTSKGTEPVSYYYSFFSDGSGRIGPVISPFSISTTVERTVYIVASNPAGNLVSAGEQATPYTFASKPVITDIVPSAYNLNVQFTGSNSGTTPITYYYSFFSDGSGRIGPVTSPFNISGGIERTVYIVADNSAGFVVSTPGFTRAPYIYGTTPEIQSIVPGPNKITVTYSPSINGTQPVYHYYSYDPSGLNGTLIGSTTFDIAGTSTRTVYIVANNIIGNVVSTGVSGTPYVVGNAPIIESVTSQTNNLRVRFSHPNPGNTAVTYYYSDDASGNNLIRQVSFGVTEPSYGEFDISGTVTRTIYVVSINSAGKLVSSPETATPFIFGTQPVIEYVNPGTEKLFVKFRQDQTGTTPVTYYYSFLADGSNAVGPVDTSFNFAEIVERTVYIVARNAAGNLVSAGVSGTPFVYGSKPVITAIVPGLNKLDISFNQATTGTTPVRYYYSEYANGSNRVGPVTSPFDISNINTQKTIYIVADNSAGIVVSDPSSGTPYLLGTSPKVDAIVPGTNKLTVSFSQTSKGTEPVTYYYSELSNGTNRVGPVTSPFDISNILVSKTVYIIAENLGGTLISVSGETGTPYIFGSSPSITNVQPGTNSLTVNFNRSVGGTTPVTHYYSYDSSGVPRVAQIPSGASTFTITDISSAKTVYIVAENPAGNLVSAGESGTPYIFGDLPVISSVVPQTNKLVVNFSQPNKGTLPVTYYYSFDGSGRLGTVTTPSFEIATLVSRTVYIIADNSAGTLVSVGVSGTPYVFGSALNVTLSSPISNTIRVSYNQETQGTTPTTYKYVLNDGSSVVVSTYPSGVFDISGLTSTSLYSIYMVASNAAGDLSSNTLTQSVLGIPPTISSVVPQTNKLVVNFSQSNKGTLPVTYYYSFDGSGRLGTVTTPSFEIATLVSRTVYIIADNSAGTLVSVGVSGTPYVFGDVPVISSIVPGSQVLTVNFSQQQTGTTPVTYYYSYDPSGTVRIGQVNPPSFDIVGTDPRTVYIVVDNSAGTLVSDGVSGTPYVFGSLPRITLIQRGSQKITVTYTQTDKGTLPVRYYYSFDRVNRIAEVTTTTFDISTVETRTVSIIADNSAGTLVSDDVSGTPYTFGSVPQIQSVTPGPNKLTVLFSQANLGNTPSSYSYSFDPSGTNPTAFDSSSTFIVNGSQPRTIYVIATNLAGSLISMGVSGTPFVVGDTPSIDDVVPGPYSLTVKFSQQNQGNTPVTYYYSYSVDGSNPQGPVYLPEFTVTAAETTTIYVVADSSSGYIVSAGFTKTPFVLGTNPEIASIKPGTEILDVSFSQTSKGTEPVTYYYSFSADGSGRIGPVISPFSISTTVERTVYIVASNPAGNLVSAGEQATPYTFANRPVITNIVPSAYNLNVQFTGSNSGTTPITYYYSFFSDGSGRIGPVTSPFNISGDIERTVYIVADNSAGFVVSTPGFTRTPYIYGTTPVIQSIVPGPNKITVTYSPSINGTQPVYHYYSYDPSGLNGTLIGSTTFDIAGTSTRTVYIVANNIIGNVVSTGVSGTPFVVGNAPIIESVTSQTNNLRVRFSHPNPGNTAVTYYYSDDASGNNLIRQVSFGETEPSYGEFDISGTVTRTIYVVSINSAGKLVSSPETATPFIFGTQPVIEYVNPGTEKLFVKFRQDQTGTTPVTYYYSFLSNGSNAIGPVDTSFSFAETVERTVYIVARNAAGNLVSAGVSGTPFIYGSKPVITAIVPGLNKLDISFNQATTGTTPVRYYYSEYANGSNRVGPVTSPFDISNINTQKTIYIVADNSAGIVVSDPSSGTPYLLGTNPKVDAIVPGTNKLTVSFSQTSKGTEPVTYYYSEFSNGTNRVGPVTSPFDISNILVSKTVYIIAENLGGTLISVSGETGTPYILGSSPSITNVQPGTNSLTVNFNRSVGGTTPVTHYYSYDSSGLPRVAQIPSGASTFTITDISSAKTIYVVAENPAGNLVSVGASGTPYIFGDLPVISSVVPQTNKLVVNFSQPNKGTLPVTYYYSFDGSGRLGTVTTPSFEIATLVSRTVYIIADNSAGTLVSAGFPGTPYVFGSALNVTLTSPISNTIRVSYNQATQGTTPTTYKYVLNGGSPVVVSTNPSGTFDISGLTSTSLYSIYMVASNAAGDLSSNTLTQSVLGIPPTISSVVPQTNKLVVNFSQSNKGTLPVTYYYSFDGSGRLGTVTTPSFEIATLVSRTVYIIADNSAGTLVSAGVDGTPYTVGVPPVVDIIPGSSMMTVYFSQTGGTEPVTYYYSESSDGSNPIGPVESPFDINDVTTERTIYIVASNIAGTIISEPAIGTAFLLGTPPIITSIETAVNGLIVYFTGSTGGKPDPYSYYYSLNGTDYILADSIQSPMIIPDLEPGTRYEVTLVAQNAAGITSPSNMMVGITKKDGTNFDYSAQNSNPNANPNTTPGSSTTLSAKVFLNLPTVDPTLPPEEQAEFRALVQKYRSTENGKLSGSDVAITKATVAIGNGKFRSESQPESIILSTPDTRTMRSVKRTRPVYSTRSVKPVTIITLPEQPTQEQTPQECFNIYERITPSRFYNKTIYTRMQRKSHNRTIHNSQYK